MGALKKGLRIVAVVAGGGAALVLFALLALVGWMKYSDWSAQRRAEAFCAGVAAGEPILDVAVRSQAQGAWWIDEEEKGVYAARFTGWGRHECRITVAGGKVATKQVVYEPYD
jgi:hypothetical protein